MQVFVNGKLIGGSEEALDLLEKGELQKMIKDSKADALPKDIRELITDTKSGLEVNSYHSFFNAVHVCNFTNAKFWSHNKEYLALYTLDRSTIACLQKQG